MQFAGERSKPAHEKSSFALAAPLCAPDLPDSSLPRILADMSSDTSSRGPLCPDAARRPPDAGFGPDDVCGARIVQEADGLRLVLPEHVDMELTAAVWTPLHARMRDVRPKSLILDAAKVERVDGAGAALMASLQMFVSRTGGVAKVENLSPDFAALVDYCSQSEVDKTREKKTLFVGVAEKVGLAASLAWNDARGMVTFIGELVSAAVYAFRRPGTVRWRDFWLTSERAGVNAFFIVALIGFLMGLIMSFQSAIPLRQFGAEIYVANFLGLSMTRELGPLVVAILLAGRTGSAFAAELGVMKVNEELSALTTMGLDPVRFLVLTRVGAATLAGPLLTMFFIVFALVGGAVVMLSLGYPLQMYMKQVVASTKLGDLAGGLFKVVVFCLLAGGIGCLRGLSAGNGADAVGRAATSAVVTAIILIAVMDGIFAVTFYALKI